MGIASGAREDEAIRVGIEQWLRQRGTEVMELRDRADLGAAAVGPISRPAAGLSTDTVFVSVVDAAGGKHDLVVRLAPVGDGLFPEYDLGRQVQVQNALAGAGIPTASPAVFEADRSWLGDEFMVMPRVPGLVVPSKPSYPRAGWLAERSRSEQAALLDDFLRTLAALHRLDLAVVGSLMGGSTVSLADTCARACDYLDWAGADGAIPGFLTDARDWCTRNLPNPATPVSIVWGDVQLGNCVFTDAGNVGAFLDFELTGTGPAELDLGWFLGLHEMTAAVAGVDLPGFGDRESMVSTYEAALGRRVEALAWYETFALLRSGAIMVRIARLLAQRGIDDSWLRNDNPTEAALIRARARAESEE